MFELHFIYQIIVEYMRKTQKLFFVLVRQVADAGRSYGNVIVLLPTDLNIEAKTFLYKVFKYELVIVFSSELLFPVDFFIGNGMQSSTFIFKIIIIAIYI